MATLEKNCRFTGHRCTPAQIALAWLFANEEGRKAIPLPDATDAKSRLASSGSRNLAFRRHKHSRL